MPQDTKTALANPEITAAPAAPSGSVTIKMDPATRVEGHLKVETTVSNGAVAAAKSSGMMFRGFENLLVEKDPRDAILVTQRVCGVCPISHAMAASTALEAAAGLVVPNNARLLRNLVLGANFLQSHILHFYHLAALSYVKGPPMPPWTPAYQVDMRLDPATNQRFVDNYVRALTVRREAHEMATIFAGHMPHTATFVYGGVTLKPNATLVSRFRAYLDRIIAFIDGTYLPDVDALGNAYPEYFNIGRGYGNLLAFGVFDLNADGSSKLLRRGRVANGGTAVQAVDLAAIMEQTTYSWYSDAARNPSNGATSPSPTKAGAYSWLKAPRYGGAPYEVGPLARMWVNGDYRRGISVMDRHKARALEARKIAYAMRDWLAQLDLSAPAFTERALPASGTGIGLTEAPRGALGHWLKVTSEKIASYQILTPTCWNFSPRDASNQPGPLEKALEGVAVRDPNQAIEVLRVVQSYDPCLSCAVH